ncbi:MAG TPA: alkaline phosphatase family protein, partial [Thermoanaerobaculia bacterium]|nr:alkaline phosphatase family protein [Thermoanaerobaculia bacterium]
MFLSRRAVVHTLLSLSLSIFVSCAVAHRSPKAQASAERPALVVVIAVDQLGEDLLERYDALFTGGFRRLKDQGMS